ncbi:MAG: ring-1,2-phenylacetyl-CoA epoxidase subunit PaaE [Gammaproteobacteria bacterium]|jgi:ring-1,2-phenylacetyl-CoA epoxidase subunit PaaE
MTQNTMAEFQQLTVASVHKETEDALCVSFVVAASQQALFRFSHGQYLTFKAQIDGEEVRRSYSICAGVDDDLLQVAIKHVPGGVFSSYAIDSIKTGTVLDVLPPAGTFTCDLHPDNEKRYLCIAAGSGITPIISIVKSILSREPNSQVSLLYGNQRVASIMFREALERLKNRYMSRLQLIHILSRESRDTEILNGRIDNKKGAELGKHLLDIPGTDEFFLCGPEGMISEVSRGLRASGVDEARIHYELFGRSADDAAAVVEKHHARARRLGGKMCLVTVKSDGRETEFELSADGENILDAAMHAGLDLPYACKGGVCATCKAKLESGQVEMDLNHALEPDELASGYVLSCQAHPVSDTVVINFDLAR